MKSALAPPPAGLGIVKSVNESRPLVATVFSLCFFSTPRPRQMAPTPPTCLGPIRFRSSPHAFKEKKTQLGDPSFRNCEEPLASERICDAQKVKTPRFLAARFDKCPCCWKCLAPLAAARSIGAARWCNIFLDILSVVIWFARFSLCWCWFSHNDVFKRLQALRGKIFGCACFATGTLWSLQMTHRNGK